MEKGVDNNILREWTNWESEAAYKGLDATVQMDAGFNRLGLFMYTCDTNELEQTKKNREHQKFILKKQKQSTANVHKLGGASCLVESGFYGKSRDI